jgi:hypothetical protein
LQLERSWILIKTCREGINAPEYFARICRRVAKLKKLLSILEIQSRLPIRIFS